MAPWFTWPILATRRISVIETVFNHVVGVINLGDIGGAPPPVAPRGVAVSPDGNRLYVTDGLGNRLFVIDTTANHAVIAIVPVGKKPYGISVSPDSKRVYVANTDDHTVSVINANPNQSTTNQVIATVPVGLGPWAFGQFTGPLVTVAAPDFEPPSGNLYITRRRVAIKITTTTPGASIRYTTDGSDPTTTSGTLVSSGQRIVLTVRRLPTTLNLKAIAFKENWADSSVVEATYFVDKK
ncbi:MAG: chitobiase/beta-hexosaminidase C-terminal domain-containing protein [Candidatus Competibacteraceae bacterium]